MSSKIIRGGTVVVGGNVSQQDVLIQGEQIAGIGQLSDISADQAVDAGGLLVLPGGVDTHVHFNDQFMNTLSVHDYYAGTLAAAFGGTTSLIDFSNQLPGETLMNTLDHKHEEAQGKALVDWGVHPVITQPTPETLAEIPAVVAAGAPTIKIYMTYRQEGLLIEEPEMRQILARLDEAGGMLLVHAEDNEMAEANIPAFIERGETAPIYHALSKPPEVENKAIADCIRLVRETGGRLFIVHLTTKEGVAMVGAAQGEGLPILAETCVHYLTFTDEVLRRGEESLKWICSPPLRDASHQGALWRGLADGRLCQVTSDDAAYSWEATLYGKDRFDLCPNGMPGIEPRFITLFSEGVAKGRISLPRFVELIAGNPARLFGFNQKGSLLPGKDADIVLLDPTVKWQMGQANSHSNNDWHAYEGMEVTGKIRQVYSRGELIIDGDDCLAERGRGKYVRRRLPANLV